MTKKILGIIPARYGSTRFPAKALVDIGGKPMVMRVYEQALKAQSLTDVIIATDHSLIFDTVTQLGGKVIMTSDQHPSGTDRCQEIISKYNQDIDYVINIQGDEPFIQPEQIDLLASILDEQTELATLVIKASPLEDIFNPNMVKVVFNTRSEAIYFSRNPIPFNRNNLKENWVNEHTYFRHIGMYAYRKDILSQITQLSISSLEKAESLEQLRWIENGYKIKVAITTLDSHSIDTPEDLEKVLASNKL